MTRIETSKEKLTGTARKRRNKQEQRRKNITRQISRGAMILIVVALVATVVTFVVRNNQSSATPDAIAGVKTFQNLARDHVTETVAYPQTPPVGGKHNEVWQNCGIYDTPLANENAVHSLEHGAVWITYNPSLGSDEVEKLRSLVQGRSYALLSPHTDLPKPVVISAWGTQLAVDRVDDARLKQFITTYEQGPQTPEPGAACSGGTGTPVEG